MRFNIKQRSRDWHRWFAWFPITLGDGKWVWWESVERIEDSYAGGLTGYHYRMPNTIDPALLPPDDFGGWVMESGPGIPARWRKLGDVDGKGVVVPIKSTSIG